MVFGGISCGMLNRMCNEDDVAGENASSGVMIGIRIPNYLVSRVIASHCVGRHTCRWEIYDSRGQVGDQLQVSKNAEYIQFTYTGDVCGSLPLADC
jgi:hypothetical protein